MKTERGLFIFLVFIFLFSGVSATISNVHIEPLYPNLESKWIIVYADITNVSSADLYYRIEGDPEIQTIGISHFSHGIAGIPYYNPLDNVKVFYWINTIDEFGNNVSTPEYNFVYDGSAPAITINGDNPLSIEVNSTYQEFGASALDSIYGDLSSSIVVSGSVDTSTLGEYNITYTVSDNAGNIATATRTVRVVEPVTSQTSSSSGGGSSGSSSSGTEAVENIIIPSTSNASTVETPNPKNKLQNNSVKGKTIGTGGVINFLGENKGISITLGILIVIVSAGFVFFKIRMKRKRFGR